MTAFLWKFQYRLSGLQSASSEPLLAIAIVTLAVGLFVWLGGLGRRKTMFALVGAYCGLTCAIPVSGLNILLAVALAGLGAMLAMKLQDTFLTLICSIFAAVYGFSILIRPYFDTSDELIVIVRQLTIGVPYYNWPMLLFLIAVPFVASASFRWGTSALLCSAAGAAVVLAGVVMLLVRSGISAAGFISTKRRVFLGVFLAVTILGAVVQMLLLPKLCSSFAAAKETVMAKIKRAKKDKHDDDKSLPTPKATAWRTA
jgi:uncharacterized membrane protein YhaH (DUF805 family)